MSSFNFDFQCRIFQCLFLMLIFDVDFQCCCLTIIFIVFFLFLFWDFFSKYFSALIISLFIFFTLYYYFLLQYYFSPFFYFDCEYFFVSFHLLFFFPQKLTYFTMIMMGHHTQVGLVCNFVI